MKKTYSLFLLTLSIGIAQLNGEGITENIHLRIKNRFKYHATFIYTVDDFLTLPYVKDSEFETEVFPKDNGQGVKWYFSITPEFYPKGRARYQGADVQVRLKLSSLPKNIASVKGSFECGIIDKNGKSVHVKTQAATNLNVEEEFKLEPLVNRNDLDRQKDVLLSEGQLKLRCKVDGNLIYEHIKIPTEIEKQRQQANPKCSRNIAAHTVQNLVKAIDLNQNGCTDVKVKASGKEFNRHKEVLSSASEVLKTKMAASNILDFGDEMSAEELEDFLSFLYQGSAPNLGQTCRALLVVANKYELNCLRHTCEDVLILKVNSETASDLLVFAEKNGATNLVKAAGLCLSKYPNCTA